MPQVRATACLGQQGQVPSAKQNRNRNRKKSRSKDGKRDKVGNWRKPQDAALFGLHCVWPGHMFQVGGFVLVRRAIISDVLRGREHA